MMQNYSTPSLMSALIPGKKRKGPLGPASSHRGQKQRKQKQEANNY